MTCKKYLPILGLIPVIIYGCQVSRPLHPANTEPNLPETTPTVSAQKPTPQKESGGNLKIYLIALEDAGKSGPVVGCGDSLVAVDVQADGMHEALRLLLDNHSRYYGQSDLYSALYQSNLTVRRFEITNEKTEVDLSGDLILGGVCDTPRVKEQLTATIRQAVSGNDPIAITINGISLDEILSQK
jgi:hypothetical protein